MEKNTLTRQHLVDKYNSDKSWEVTELIGGYYLRQYIKGRQVGRGVRVTKAFLKNIGLLI